MDPQENLLASIYPQGFLTKRQLATPGEAVSFFQLEKCHLERHLLWLGPLKSFTPLDTNLQHFIVSAW